MGVCRSLASLGMTMFRGELGSTQRRCADASPASPIGDPAHDLRQFCEFQCGRSPERFGAGVRIRVSSYRIGEGRVGVFHGRQPASAGAAAAMPALHRREDDGHCALPSLQTEAADAHAFEPRGNPAARAVERRAGRQASRAVHRRPLRFDPPLRRRQETLSRRQRPRPQN